MVNAEDPWLRSSANGTALATISVPTLVITGEADLITPAANSRLIATRIPNATLRIVAGAGHSFLFQQPEVVARDVLRFLDSG